ncbi:MAG: TolC family protein [Muribaculaceae bacterium]|nr:TolC family protein [Muribaculaceae bacterium]
MKSIEKLIMAGWLVTLSPFVANAQDSVATAPATVPAAVPVAYQEKPFTWTLQDCIDWAKQQNITIQRNKVNVRSLALDLENARNNRLPTVNFSSNQQVGYRPFQETHSSVIGSEVISSSNRTSYSGSYGVNASMSLYDGGQIKNNIKLAEINSQIAELNVLASELSIEEQITQLYVQILYSQDAVTQDDELIALGQVQLDRAKALKKAGLLNKADVSQLESQLAQDKYQKVADETTLDNYRLQLKQIMELDGDESLVLADPTLENDVLAELPSKQAVYQHAVENRPEIKAQQLAMDRTYIDEKIAEAGNKPNLSASAGINTSNMSGNGNMFNQLKNQWNNGIGVTLSIPIWDHGKTKNAVAKARLERESTYLDMIDTQKSLWKTIENYWLQARNSQQRYIAAKENVDYCRESYNLTSEQFRLGMKNIVELTQDKTNLSSATQQMLQAKYTALLNIAMLKYYNGESIAF